MKMIRESILNGSAALVGYLHEPSPEIPNRTRRPAVLICPGGAYEFRSDREADPPAFSFLNRGYQAFVLEYTTGRGKACGMTPLRELSAAVALMREKADEWHLIPDQIAVMGFSAGGHLAASLGVLWDHPSLGCPNGENRPNALILCYPVITSGEFAHRQSLENVSGEEDPAKQTFWSLETHVSDRTPPAFLWHTYEDDAVPVENSLLFVSALRRAGVPCEFHLFEKGVHGLSLCNAEVATPMPPTAPWMGLCLTWLSNRFSFEE